jgi:UDP-glucose 4-epimerase
MMSVLVTGATSPMGEELIRSLLADTRVAHILAVGEKPAERALPFAHGKRLTYQQVDLTRSRRVRTLLFGPARDLNVEVVVHMAHHRSASGGRKVHALNVEALRSILALSNRHPTIRRVVVKSFAEVYRVSLDLPILVTEDHPLNLEGNTPQYIRDRVEADLTACARMGLSSAEIVVLRCAEALGPGTGSQLYDFLQGQLAFRPFGFDPMINVATVADIVRAIEKATHGSGEGVFNVPGYDSLPLSVAIRKWGVTGIPVPGTLIRPLYNFRRRLLGSQFSYGINRKRMHLGLVLDGSRAREVLEYTPQNPVHWPNGGAVNANFAPTL